MRASGILLPVSSLPGPYGIGCFSAAARAFVDWLAAAGQTMWQILPLGPTSYGDSPYQSFSTFAGNPYFIDPDTLAAAGLLTAAECAAADCAAAPDDIDYGLLYQKRRGLLRRAFARWRAGGGEQTPAYGAFLRANAAWLDDYALFTAIKAAQGGAPWDAWPDPLRLRAPAALAEARRTLAEDCAFERFIQFEFDAQWRALKAYANGKGVRIVGDIPIYVAFDSADTWANPALFQLDADRRPTGVAGVPPDGFSATGQLWGNPLYDWDAMKKTGYAWWVRRIRHTCRIYDVVRIDHFRGFAGYYAIPYGSPDARGGRWRTGPGMDLFRTIEKELGRQNIIAEDLGYLTPDVYALLADVGYPGMKVLEFAFDSPDGGGYLPHSYPRSCVAYTGTHDNEPVNGWFENASPIARQRAVDYFHLTLGEGYHWGMVRGIWSSVADLAVAQAQDILGLGLSSRMNTPSTLGGNWCWRARPGAFSLWLAEKLRHMTEIYGRVCY